MKKFIALVLFAPMIAFGAANDLLINQRNATDTGTLSRTVTIPAAGANGLFGFNGTSVLPVFYTVGSGLTLTGGVLSATAIGQVNADWNASSGVAQILNKPTLFNGAYSSLTGIPATFTPSAHTQAWSTITTTPTTLGGYGITDAYPLTGNPSAFITQSGARTAISLTTTGTSGVATYSSATGVLNVPIYANSGGTVTSVTAGTGLSGGTITAAGTISMPNTGTAGSYTNVTTDAQGRVTSGTNRSQSAATRVLNTIFQISTARDAWVSYSVQITVTASIAGGQNGDVILEIASDSGFTANVQTLAISGLGQTYTLAIALQGIQPQTVTLPGYVPAGYYARLRTVNVTGTPAFLYRAGQEVFE